MFLHIGGNMMIKKDTIISILDLETATSSSISKDFIETIYKNGEVNSVSEEGKDKSFIITNSGCYISPISSSTLLKRSYSKIDL